MSYSYNKAKKARRESKPKQGHTRGPGYHKFRTHPTTVRKEVNTNGRV